VLDSGLANLPSQESWSSRSSPSGKYGIIAFGKRLTRHVELFKHVHDLKASGSNKFTVSFCDGSLANKFVDYFNQNRNLIFQDESWLAYIHNYKVIRQFVMRGIDDNVSVRNCCRMSVHRPNGVLEITGLVTILQHPTAATNVVPWVSAQRNNRIVAGLGARAPGRQRLTTLSHTISF
ncbi:type iv secretion protein rhs, partial [Lasius niger]